MKLILKIILFNILFSNYFIDGFDYQSLNTTTLTNDISSNAIYELSSLDGKLWLRTGTGLSFLNLGSILDDFNTLNNENLPIGGLPAFIISDDIFVVSGSKSIFENGRYRPMGTGISWSTDSGNQWNYIEQPKDENPENGVYVYSSWGEQDSVAFKAITTDIYNVTYDLAELNGYIYATSFAGGLRRFSYNIDNPNWELVPLPMDSQSFLNCNEIDIDSFEYDPVNPPEGNDNHKAFSVYSDDNILWVGTGDGINKGIVDSQNNCIDWTHYNESDGMGDRWVIGIKNQQINELKRLWAITWDPSLNTAIPHNLTYTDDEGVNWEIVSFFKNVGAIVYDLNFDENQVFASTSLGLFVANSDNLDFWEKYDIKDENGQLIFSDAIYSSFSFNGLIYASTIDGIFLSQDDGLKWQIYRSWSHTNQNNILSAYPNPFYIDETNQYNSDGHVRIVYYNQNLNDEAKLDIFDFSMRHIQSLNNPVLVDQEGQFIWNGRDFSNDQVQNGIYFCRLNLSNKFYWTKIMVINS